MRAPNINSYLESLQKWSGYNLDFMEDFDVICKSEIDFIDLLLLYEKKFSLNMLDNDKSKEDFNTIQEFIGWASSNPPAPKYYNIQ